MSPLIGMRHPASTCDVDHVISWINDGVTSQFNGRLQCRPHNRFAHLHGGDGEPLPHVEVTELHVATARLQWRLERIDWWPGRTAA